MSEILTSIHGRQVGLDKDGYLTARIGAKVPALLIGTSGSEVEVDIEDSTTVTAATSATTGTTISSRGITTLSSGGTAFVIGPPATGVRKVLATLTSSTLARTITRNGTSFTFQSTDGSTMVKLSMASPGAVLEMVGLSTALWGVISRLSTDTTLSGTS